MFSERPDRIEATTQWNNPEHTEKVAKMTSALKGLRSGSKKESSWARSQTEVGQTSARETQNTIQQKEAQLAQLSQELKNDKAKLNKNSSTYAAAQGWHANELSGNASKSWSLASQANDLASEIVKEDPNNARAAREIADNARNNGNEASRNANTIRSGAETFVSKSTQASREIDEANAGAALAQSNIQQWTQATSEVSRTAGNTRSQII